MPQQTSPFIEGKYGWAFGESGWNSGMDEDLLKFSFLHDGNIDGVVGTLPAVVNGKAYFLTSDNRTYFAVGGVWYSTPTPLRKIFNDRSSGARYQFTGAGIVNLPSDVALNTSLTSLQTTVGSLNKASVGLGNVDNTSDVNKPVSTAQQTAINTKVNVSDLLNSTDNTKGASLVGAVGRLVNTVADLRLLTGRYDKDQIWLLSHTTLGFGGGVFRWDATNVVADNNGTIFKATATTTGRWVRVIGDLVATPYWFGAVADASTDNSTALQSWITWIQLNGNRGHVPAGVFNYATAPTQTARLHLTGAGRGIAILQYTGNFAGWNVAPPTSGETNRFWKWEGFSIRPLNVGGGTYGMNIVLATGCYMSNFDIEDMEIGSFSLQGIHFDNSIGNTDGFFTGTVRRNWITNGIIGQKMGDSLEFMDNTITGLKCGIEFTGLPGARQMIISGNNITTSGGHIALIGVEQPRILCNQIEQPSTSPYSGVYGCSMYLSNCFEPLVHGNTINPNNSATTIPGATIAMDGGTSNPVFSLNDIQKGGSVHFSSDATVIGIDIRPDNTYYGAALVDGTAGPSSKNLPQTLTLTNAWVAFGGAFAIPKYIKGTDGFVTLSGSMKSGTGAFATLPAAFRPTSTVVLTVTTASAIALIQITSAGVCTVVSGGNTQITLDGARFPTTY